MGSGPGLGAGAAVGVGFGIGFGIGRVSGVIGVRSGGWDVEVAWGVEVAPGRGHAASDDVLAFMPERQPAAPYATWLGQGLGLGLG